MPPSRQCAESAFELLLLQLIANTTAKNAPNASVVILEKMGFTVGCRLVEKAAHDRTRFQTTLEIVKFICKDFWNEAFGKQVDGLRTNHRGVYVLVDQKFRWLIRTFLPENTDDVTKHTYTAFPCGVLRGALTTLGLACTVEAEVTALPAVTFTLKLTQ